MGRSGIKALTDEEFLALKASVKHKSTMSTRRFARRIKSTLNLLRGLRKDRVKIAIRGYSYSHLMDTLVPERRSQWKLSWHRKEKENIELNRFSFLDSPVSTLNTLQMIAKAECSCKSINIHFVDEICLDIVPYMLLGLMRQQMLPIIEGGYIRPGIRSVLQAVNLDKLFNMKKVKVDGEHFVLPFKMRRRRQTGSSVADNRSEYVTSEERVGTQLTHTINRWLAFLPNPRQLAQEYKSRVLTLITEVLDNAKRHGDSENHDGTWSIAGFMEVRVRMDETIAYVCHIGITNPGATIYESLQQAPTEMLNSLKKLTRYHESTSSNLPMDEEALWTYSSLQDGVSRIPLSTDGAPGGFGMMTLIEAINALGRSSRADEQPKLTIISGSSCVMVRDAYREPHLGAKRHRILAFNPRNRLDELPDPDYVFNLPHRLPGTCVSVRFFLDEAELDQAENRKNDRGT